MCVGLLAEHAAHHYAKWHLPVIDPVIKLLSDLAITSCLQWWWWWWW
jgi:hypothetical protein